MRSFILIGIVAIFACAYVFADDPPAEGAAKLKCYICTSDTAGCNHKPEMTNLKECGENLDSCKVFVVEESSKIKYTRECVKKEDGEKFCSEKKDKSVKNCTICAMEGCNGNTEEYKTATKKKKSAASTVSPIASVVLFFVALSFIFGIQDKK